MELFSHAGNVNVHLNWWQHAVSLAPFQKKKKSVFRKLKIEFSTEAAASEFKVKTKWVERVLIVFALKCTFILV